MVKEYFQYLRRSNPVVGLLQGLWLIYPVNESGAPIEALYVDQKKGRGAKPIFLNQNNGWFEVFEIEITTKQYHQIKDRLKEWQYHNAGFYPEYPEAPRNYEELEERDFHY